MRDGGGGEGGLAKERERARVRQMSAVVLNAGVITSTAAWPQVPPSPADSERPAS